MARLGLIQMRLAEKTVVITTRDLLNLLTKQFWEIWKVVFLKTSDIENDENSQMWGNLKRKMESKIKASVEWQYILWTKKRVSQYWGVFWWFLFVHLFVCFLSACQYFILHFQIQSSGITSLQMELKFCFMKVFLLSIFLFMFYQYCKV